MIKKLRFGTGGMPLSTPNRSAVNGIKRIRELGLDAMELEFVYQVFTKTEEQREAVKKQAEESDVAISVHGSYFINLASPEKPKWHASINRVLESAKAGDECGARSVTFHAAAYMKRDHEEVYGMVKEAFGEIFTKYREKNLNIRISPELTGKAAQFGDLEVLIRLIEDFGEENIGLCFDFAHKHARDGGGWNSYEEFDQMLKLIRKHLGQSFLDDMHMHMSGINYSAKGERNHLTFLPSQEAYREAGIDVGDLLKHYEELAAKNRLVTPDIKWKELMQALKDNKVGGVLICESPNLEEDALLMQQFYNSLK